MIHRISGFGNPAGTLPSQPNWGVPTVQPRFASRKFLDRFYPSSVPEPAVKIYPEKKKGPHKNILLPDGIPVFYLHGTWSTTATLKPIIDFIGSIQTNHPSYMSFIPEVKDGSGIESVGELEDVMPSYKLAVRDMGDFQFQFVYKNLKKIREILDGPPEKVDKALGDHFRILPEERYLLVPVIRRHLENSMFDVSSRLNISEPLWNIVEQGVGRVRREFKKLRLDVDNLDMMDTFLLYNRAEAEGKTINLDMYEVHHDPQVVNLRPLNLRDVAFLNGYLLFLEQELTEAVKQAYLDHTADVHVPTPMLDMRSEKIARKLMEKIAPRGMAFGHSQGGTVLMSALLRYLSVRDKSPDAYFDLNAPQADDIAARYIGIGALFSAPLHGIPDEPLWAKPLAEFAESIERRIRGGSPDSEGTVSRWLAKKIGWFFFEHNRPAVPEMRQDSDLMLKFQHQVNLLKGREVTMISAHDEKDTFIEPSATILTNEDGDKFANIFNLALEMPKVDNPYLDPQDVIETEIRHWKLHPEGTLAKLLRRLPRKVHEFLFETYAKSFSGLEQHRALLNYPGHVHRELGGQLIKDPERQLRLLNTDNFEPFRYQSLIARRKITAKEILAKPIGQGLDALQAFIGQHPSYLDALLQNARPSLPFENSAAYEATMLLEDMLTLMENALDRKMCFPDHSESMRRALQQIARANLIPVATGRTSISDRARALLHSLNDQC